MNKYTLTKFIAFTVLVVGAWVTSATTSSPQTSAAPACMSNPITRSAAHVVSNAYPRDGATVNSAGCGAVSKDYQWVLLSSYYHNGSGAPGSTLHTPNARFRVFSYGAPTSAITIRVTLSSNSRCNYTSGSDINFSINGSPPYTNIDNVLTYDYVINPAGQFSQNTAYGTAVWGWNNFIQVSANVATSIHCRIRVESLTANTYVTLFEDPDPVTPHGIDPNNRFNQNNAGTGAGQKRRLGPNTAASSGAMALYSTLDGANLEYALPFKEITGNCSDTSTHNIQIRFYDSDAPNGANPAGTTQPAGFPGLAIYEEATGALAADWVVPTANDEYGEFTFTMKRNTSYTMVWYNISSRNGIQFWMPFSDIAAMPGNGCGPSGGAVACSPNGPFIWERGTRHTMPITISAGPASTDAQINAMIATGLQVGVVNPNGGDPANWNAPDAAFVAGTTPPDKTFTWGSDLHDIRPESNIGSTEFWWDLPAPFSNGNFYYQRLIVQNRAAFSYSVQAPNALGTYKLGLRFLDRAPGVWLPYDASCTVDVTVIDPIIDLCSNIPGPQSPPLDPIYTVVGTICTIPEEPHVQCANITALTGFLVEPNQDFLPRIELTRADLASSPAVTVTVTFDVANAVTGIQVPGSVRVATGVMTYSQVSTFGLGAGVTYPSAPATPIALPVLSSYQTRVTVSYTTVPAQFSGECTGAQPSDQEVDVVGKPYFKVVGDIVSTGGLIRGWNRAIATHYTSPTPGDASGRSGAGTTGAIISASSTANDLNGVMSSYFNASGLKRLTFGNTGAGASIANSSWGGGFGVPTLSPLPTAPTGTPAYSGVQSGEFTSGSMSFAGGIPANTKMTVYVTGNLNITGPVTYPATYGNISNIPHLRFVVSGNIYINPGATNIAGEYMSAGRIYTCHDGSNAWGTPIVDSSANLAVSCAAPLRVNGALVGNSIRLTRTTGLLENASVSGGFPFADAGNTAETILFSPEIYLSTPFSNTTTTAGSFDYDSVTSLPPLF